MRQFLTVLFLSISLAGFGQASKLKAALEFADEMKGYDKPKYTYKAFILYDWYEDYRTIVPMEKQREYGLPDKSEDLKTCIRRIKTQSGYSESQKFVVDVLIEDRRPSGYCPEYTHVTTPQGSSGLAGSGVRFKTDQDLLLAYSLMDRTQQDKYKEMISEDLRTELERFEAVDFFEDYPELLEQNRIEVDPIVALDHSDEQILAEAEVNNLLNAGAIQQLSDTNINPAVSGKIVELLNKQQNLDQKVERIQSGTLNLSDKDLKRIEKAASQLQKATQQLNDIE